MEFLAAVLLAGFSGLVGTILGATIAARESAAARDDARRARFTDQVHGLLVELLEAAPLDIKDARILFEARLYGADPDRLIETRSRRLILRLRLLVRTPSMLVRLQRLDDHLVALVEQARTVDPKEVDLYGADELLAEQALKNVDYEIRAELGTAEG